MAYVNKNLNIGENVIYLAKLHWSVFLTPVILLLIGILLLSGNSGFGWVLLFLALFRRIVSAVEYFTSEFALTNQRVLIKVGFISRNSVELLLSKIEGIIISQGILDRILNSGTVRISGAGISNTKYPNIANPLELRRQVQKQISNL